MHFKEAKSILSKYNGMNIYRGCTHGCIYCDARSECYQMDHSFEDVEVKENAIELLDDALRKKKYPIMVGTGGMSDPYLHHERDLLMTRKALEVINKYNCGIVIQTKSDLILRDLVLLSEINKKSKAIVQMTLTTYDDNLCKILEPNVCVTSRRFEVLKIMHEAGIKTIVWIAPILPFINDTEENLRGLIKYCKEAHVYGIICFGFGVTLRKGDREYFFKCLDRSFPNMKSKYLNHFGLQYENNSPNNDYLYKILKEECEKNNIILNNNELFKYMSEYPKRYHQLSLFEME